MKLTKIDWENIEREACSRSLALFVRQAWHVIEPSQPYVHGWHIDAICEHLEAITRGQINRLLINIPPGAMKSTLVSVFWPAWEWGPAGFPSNRIISTSHEQGLAVRDNRKMRNLIKSDWYQSYWPINLVGDQNQKTYFENDKTGFRQACAFESMTGRRGDRVIGDDVHSIEGGLSDIKREKVIREFRETLPSRVVNPDKSAIIFVMQRIHEGDVAGYILKNDLGYEHLCLPMEYEKERHCKTSIGFSDPRKKDGELLFPERFSREVVDRDKKVMGTYAVAGQFQQRPAPRVGGFFDWEKIEIKDAAPAKLSKIVRYWDKAGTSGGGARTAGVKIGRCNDGFFWVLDVVKGQWGAVEREKVIRQTAELDGKSVLIWIEQEPGSGGKESSEATIRRLAGFNIRSERPTGDKEVRAEPYAVQVEAGNVRVINNPIWTQEFIDEHKTFPAGDFKDQIDAVSGGFNKLSINSVSELLRSSMS